MLEEEGFSVAASCLGGRSGVQIHFHTETGEVLLRRSDRDERNGEPNRRDQLICRKASITMEGGGDRWVPAKIRVLIVDDSAVVRQTLKRSPVSRTRRSR